MQHLDNPKKLQIRLERKLFEKYVRLAARDGRTLSGWVRHIIAQHVRLRKD